MRSLLPCQFYVIGCLATDGGVGSGLQLTHFFRIPIWWSNPYLTGLCRSLVGWRSPGYFLGAGTSSNKSLGQQADFYTTSGATYLLKASSSAASAAVSGVHCRSAHAYSLCRGSSEDLMEKRLFGANSCASKHTGSQVGPSRSWQNVNSMRWAAA